LGIRRGGCWGKGGGRAREFVCEKKKKKITIEVYNFFNASNALPPYPILTILPPPF